MTNTPTPRAVVLQQAARITLSLLRLLGTILYQCAIWSPLGFIIGPIRRELAERQRQQAATALDQIRAAKVKVDLDNALVRKKLLEEQIRTQNARTNLVENQGVLTDLKIEEKRADLGIVDQPWKANNY